MKFESLKEPCKFEIECRDTWLWYMLYMQMKYFEEGKGKDIGKTKVRFGRRKITVWIDGHYCAILLALHDVMHDHPNLLKAQKKSMEWLKEQTARYC